MIEIAIFRLPNNYGQTLNILAGNQSGTIFVSVQEGISLIASIETDNWQEIIGFLRKHEFQRYEARKIIPAYFEWIEGLKRNYQGINR